MIAILAAFALQAAPQAGALPLDLPEPPIVCAGEHIQGAMLVCRTVPGAQVSLGDITVTASQTGHVVLGHDRDAAEATTLAVRLDPQLRYEETVSVAQREYEIQRIEGVPPEYVSPPPETLDRIRAEGAQKAQAYTSRWDGQGFLADFVMPAEGIITGVYGSQRFYNGEPRRPHYGLDVAAETGTEVRAPAPGVVTLAEADMYFEGGLIFIDHGQGFISGFLHLSGVSVEAGDVVEQGDVIGEIGAGGRATGAHLDWRIKWHNRYIDPALVLQVDPEAVR